MNTKSISCFISFLLFVAFSTFSVRAGLGQEISVQTDEAPKTSVPSTPTQKTKAPKVDLLAGQWCGNWASCKNGHNGKLRATFCRLNDRQVQAVFVGSFAKILPFRYKAVLEIIHEDENLIQLRGSQKLGPIMGTFSYEATITAGHFDASYRSKRDCGKWTMKSTPCCN